MVYLELLVEVVEEAMLVRVAEGLVVRVLSIVVEVVI